MDLPQVLINALEYSFGGIVLCIALFVFLVVDKSFTKKVTNYFLFGIVSVFLLILAEAGTYICSKIVVTQANYTSLLFGRYICSFIEYSLRPFVVYCFASIIDKKRFALKEKTVPLLFLANTINNFVSIFTGHIFSFSYIEGETSIQYTRGPAYYLTIAVFVAYGIYFCYVLISSYKRQNLGFTILAWVAVPIAVCFGFIEMLSQREVRFLVNTFFAVALAMFYIYLHIENFKRDGLTGLLTRKQMYTYFESHRKKQMEIIVLDINDLKKMNDSEGHVYGDNAIIKVANCLKDVANKKTQVFRMGGDEFLVLSLDTPEEIDDLCIKLDEKLSETDIAVAYGRSTYHPGESFEKATHRADVCMYASKIAFKNSEEFDYGEEM